MIDEKRSETLRLERTLQRLFGETSYHVEKTPCRGKFRGHNDYSIVFGSGRKLFIGQDKQSGYENGRRQLLPDQRQREFLFDWLFFRRES